MQGDFLASVTVHFSANYPGKAHFVPVPRNWRTGASKHILLPPLKGHRMEAWGQIHLLNNERRGKWQARCWYAENTEASQQKESTGRFPLPAALYIWPRRMHKLHPKRQSPKSLSPRTSSAFILITQAMQSRSLSHPWYSSGFPIFDTAQVFPRQEKCAHLPLTPASSIQPFLTESCNCAWNSPRGLLNDPLLSDSIGSSKQERCQPPPTPAQQLDGWCPTDKHTLPSCSLVGLPMMSCLLPLGIGLGANVFLPHKAQILQDKTYLCATSARRYWVPK